MCWTCNALCGGCRPPRKKAVKCPECNTFNIYDIEKVMDFKVCKKCGKDLTKEAVPVQLLCKYCGEICYNPCRKAKTDPPGGLHDDCLVRAKTPIIVNPL